MTLLTSPRLAELLRMRHFLDKEIADERHRLSTSTTASLVQAAADLYATTTQAICGSSREKSTSQARMTACWLLRQHGLSYPEIGRTLSCDHTTAHHACQVIERDPTRLAMARQLLAQEG